MQRSSGYYFGASIDQMVHGERKKRKRNRPCSVAYKLQSFQSLCSDHTQHVLKMPESLYFSIEKNIPLVKM